MVLRPATFNHLWISPTLDTLNLRLLEWDPAVCVGRGLPEESNINWMWKSLVYIPTRIFMPNYINTHTHTHTHTHTRAYVLSCFSHVWLCGTLWTVACQTPLPMGFPRQEYWSGLPFPSPGDLSHPGIKPLSPVLQEDSFTAEPPRKFQLYNTPCITYNTQHN